MKKEYIQVKTAKEAAEIAPWASYLQKVKGGYMAFESVNDYETWKNQK